MVKPMAQSVAVKTAGLALAFSLSSQVAFAAGETSDDLPQLDLTTWPTQIFWLVVSLRWHSGCGGDTAHWFCVGRKTYPP